MKERDIDLIVDTFENSFYWPGDRTPDVRAQNVNTLDEVPDSNWFTNRLGTRAITVDELFKGPDTVSGPGPETGRSLRRRTTGCRQASPCGIRPARSGSSSSIRQVTGPWQPGPKSS